MTDQSYPAQNAVAVTKSDSTVLNARALYVGGAGDVAIMPKKGGTAVTFVAVPAGAILPVYAAKVMSTNTTATSIIALY